MTRDVSLRNKNRGGVQNSTLNGDRTYSHSSEDFADHDSRYFSSTTSVVPSSQLSLHHSSPYHQHNLHHTLENTTSTTQHHLDFQQLTPHYSTAPQHHSSPCPKLNLHHSSPCPKLSLHHSQAEHHSGPCPKLNLHHSKTSEHSGPCPKLNLHNSSTSEHHSGPCPKLSLHNSGSEHHSGPCPKLNLHNSGTGHHSGPCPKLNLHNSGAEHHSGPCPKLSLHNSGGPEHHSGPCPKLNLHNSGTSAEHHSGPCPKLNLHKSGAPSDHHSGPCPKLNLHHSTSYNQSSSSSNLNLHNSQNQNTQLSHHHSNSGVMNSNYQSSSTMFSSQAMMGYGNVFQSQPNHKGNSGVSNRLKETIHSGQFMVSDFEPESEVLDEEYEAGMPVPCVTEDDSAQGAYGMSSTRNGSSQHMGFNSSRNAGHMANVANINQKFVSPEPIPAQERSGTVSVHRPLNMGMPFSDGSSGHVQGQPQTTIIDGSLTKLFQCMSLAYRQKLTSPKWNPFKGVRLRWKDKIRLNNVIWRCWHMQFILKQRAMVCQFASPLDNDQHNKPEAVVMEGKYWKRKLSTVAAEYKKWRLFYRNRIMGWTHHHPVPDLHPVSLDGFDWNRPGTFGNGPMSNIVFDDELLMDFSDTLFSSLSSQPFAFPNPRELSRAGMVADFIQPGLVQLQPNLDDFMDTLEPFHDYVNTKFLPAVPEQLELDNLDISDDHLLNVDLPNLIQSRMQQSQFSKHGVNHSNVHNSQQGSYSSPQVENSSSQSPMFYSLTQMNEVSHRPQSNNSVQNSALSKENQKQSSGKNSSGYQGASNYRDDMFAVPKGKPRGRSRSGNRVHSSSHSNFAMAPLTTTNPQTSSQSQQQPSSSHITQNQIQNSQTLLSHLLTTPGHGHYSTGSGSADKKGSSSRNSGNQHVISHGGQQQQQQQQSSLPMPGSLIDIQQHQQQPWNPKNAKDTLGSNVSLNFGSTSLSQGNSIQNPGSAENASPTRMSTTPSPPMGGASGPPTPPKLFRGKNDNEKVPVFQEHRRVCHINAEQKRRCNIKNGFDMLHSLIPQLSHNPNAKVSKAAMLQKGAEYIRQLKIERAKLKQDIEAHRQEVEALNSAINNCQSMLPATGAPVSRQRTNKMKEMFDQWVRMRTLENWKFWLFSILVRPLLDSFNNAVSTSSLDELCRTVLTWIDQHCSLVDLRPAVLNSLRFLCTTTDILTNPATLPEEATRAVNRQDNNSEMSGGNSS